VKHENLKYEELVGKTNDNLFIKFIFELLFVFVGVYMPVATAITYIYKIEIDMTVLTCIAILLSAFTLFLSLLKKHKVVVYLLVAFVLIFLGIKFFNYIVDGAIYTVDGLKRCARDSGYVLAMDVSNHEYKVESSEDATNAFVYTILVLSAINVVYFVRTRKNVIMVLLASLVLIFYGIFVDLLPNMLFFGASIAFIFATITYSGTKKILDYRAILNAVLTLIAISVISVVTLIAIPKEAYVRPAFFNEIKDEIDVVINDALSSLYDRIVGKNGMADRGNLSNSDKRAKYDNETDLTVVVPYAPGHNIYLKGYTGHEFYDEQWYNNNLPDIEIKNFNPDNWTYTALDIILSNKDSSEEILDSSLDEAVFETTLEVRKTKDTNAVTFLTEGVTLGDIDYKLSPVISDINTRAGYILPYMYIMDDSLLSETGIYDRLLNALKNFDSITSEEIRDINAEVQYREYVNENYLSIDEKYVDIIDEIIDEIDFGEDCSYLECIKKIRDYYDENYMYSLKNTRSNTKEDALIDFVKNSKKGYCIHFATLSTLILRRLGYPTRYCEGYVLTSEMMEQGVEKSQIRIGNKYFAKIVEVDVPDNKAHAWVEVYVNGYGWMAVETTPGSAGFGDAGQREHVYRRPEEETTTANETRSHNNSIQDITEEETEEETNTETVTAFETTTTNKSKNNDNKSQFNRYIKYIFLGILIGVLFILVIWVIIYNVNQIKLNKLMSLKNSDYSINRTRKLYAYFEKLLYYIGVSREEGTSYYEFIKVIESRVDKKVDFSLIINNILKASFSEEHSVSEAELHDIIVEIRRLDDDIYKNLSNYQKFIYKYFIMNHCTLK